MGKLVSVVSLTPEALYLQLGSLVAEMPDLTNGPITPEMNQWLGRAIALIKQNDPFDLNVVALQTYSRNLNTVAREQNAQAIAAIVHEALAKAELAAPAAVQGTFIAVGHTYDAYAAVSKVLGTAKTDVLMIDPYADEKVLRDCALSAPDAVSVRILADAEYYYQSLKPAAENWARQFGSTRPLAVRLTAPRLLHDRSILVDSGTAWTLGQSFKDLAMRSHTALVRLNPEAEALMIATCETMWNAATPL
jgi:hypothetical protein